MNVLSLFDGMGCGAIALKELGITVNNYYASEVDKHAIKTSTLNFPNVVHLGDVTKWRDWNIEWRSIDLLLAGSPCFVAGTKIISQHEIKNIEDVKVGEMVLTHNNSYQKVLKVGGKITDTFILKTQGHVLTETTSEHPFLSRKRKKVWDNKRRKYFFEFDEPKWVKLKNLDIENDYLCTPILESSVNNFNITKEEAFLIGVYIGDGHTRKDFRSSENRPLDRHWQLIISVGSHEQELFKSKFKDLKFSFYKHTQSVYRAVFSSKRLVEFVEKYCGRGAENKFFSKEILDLPKDILEMVLEGYIFSDGSYRKDTYRATTVSKLIADTLPIAVAKVYKTICTVEYTKRPSITIIQGRTVNQKNTWTISFRKLIKKQSNFFFLDNVLLTPIKSIEKNKIQPVFNIEVENDNSYVANNLIVHNCQGFSFAGKQLAFDDSRSKLFFVFIDILNHVKSINPNVKYLLENVKMAKEHENVISQYCGIKPIVINAALVSAQNRVRLFWTNIYNVADGMFGDVKCMIPQPNDRGILLKDILESDVPDKYYLSEKAIKFVTSEMRLKKKYTQNALQNEKSLTHLAKNQTNWCGDFVAVPNSGGNHSDMTLVACIKFGRTEEAKEIRKESMRNGKDHTPFQSKEITGIDYNKMNTLTTVGGKDNLVMQLNPSSEFVGQPRQQNRVYDINGQSPALLAQMSCGTHAILVPEATKKGYTEIKPGECFDFENPKSETRRGRKMEDKSNCLMAKETDFMHYTKDYRIRRLTPLECCRLQTVPSWYKWDGISDTQQYRMLGNGWCISVITHILSYL